MVEDHKEQPVFPDSTDRGGFRLLHKDCLRHFYIQAAIAIPIFNIFILIRPPQKKHIAVLYFSVISGLGNKDNQDKNLNVNNKEHLDV